MGSHLRTKSFQISRGKSDKTSFDACIFSELGTQLQLKKKGPRPKELTRLLLLLELLWSLFSLVFRLLLAVCLALWRSWS